MLPKEPSPRLPAYGTFEENDAMASPGDQPRHVKWVMVGLLSLLSGLNQAICYSYAPIAKMAEASWDYGVESTTLITIYFIVYLPFAFVGSWVMDKKGLRYGVLLGAILQAVGASIRYLATAGHVDSSFQVLFLVLGQTLAAMAMPFMVNSPPMLSALWFPPSQRAAATSIAVNCNQLGIAVVYLLTPFLVHSPDDVAPWSGVIALLALLSTALACCFFQRSPLFVASSTSYDAKQWVAAFHHDGFGLTVLVFSIAETVINVLSSMLTHILNVDGFSKTQEGLIGAAFIVSALFGGQCLSAYVDATKAHKKALTVCLVLTAIALLLFELVLATSDVLPNHVVWTLVCLMAAGLFLGPLQPISLELGVECAHPTTEATVAALQQLCGNLLSAIAVPLLSILSHAEEPVGDDVITWLDMLSTPQSVLSIALLLTAVAFCHFKGKFKRFAKESNSSEDILV